jgi:hypothetical protein
MKFLRQLGYKNPRHYKICCGIDCVTLVSGTKCPNCDKLRDKCTDYFVLGLNVESVFSSVSKIHDHMAHWEERDNWFNIEDITVPYKGASVAKWLAHLPFTSEAAGSNLTRYFLDATRTQSSCEKSKSQRSAESRGFSPGTPVSSHRES